MIYEHTEGRQNLWGKRRVGGEWAGAGRESCRADSFAKRALQLASLATGKTLQKPAVSQSVSPGMSIWSAYEIRHTHLLHRLHGRRWVLVAAEVDDDPGDVAEEGDGDRRVDERQ